MSYREDFRFSSDGYGQENIWINIERPETIYELSRVRTRDLYAEKDIALLESLIADLKEYRQDLARRYSELDAMTYTFKLYLVRDRSWSTKKVTYTVRLARVLEDGKELNDINEVYSGADRKKAFERFEELKKSRPGIEVAVDTEKRRWEK